MSFDVHVKNENITQMREITEDRFTVKFLKKLLSVHVFVAEDFTLEIILCMSINESSSSKILSSILRILFLNEALLKLSYQE